MITRIFTFCFLGIVLTSMTFAQSPAQKYFDIGLASLDEYDFEAALVYFDQALQVDENYLIGYTYRGYANLNLGKLDEAIEDFTEALKHNPKAIDNLKYRSQAYISIGRFDLALTDLVQAIKINPGDPDIYYYRAKYFQELGDIDRAIGEFDKAIKLKPDDDLALLERTELLQLKAEQMLQDDTEMESVTMVNESVAALREDRAEEAIDSVASAVTDAMANEVKKFEILNKPKEKISPKPEQEEKTTKEKKLEHYYQKGSYFLSNGFYHQAITSYNKGLNIDPESTRILNGRGMAFQAMEKFPEAIKDYTLVILINPLHKEAYWNRVFAHIGLGNINEAIKDLSTVIKLAPDDYEAYGTRAALYFVKEDYDRSWEDIHKVESFGFSYDLGFLDGIKDTMKISNRRTP